MYFVKKLTRWTINNNEPNSPARQGAAQQENFETPERQIRRGNPAEPPQLQPRENRVANRDLPEGLFVPGIANLRNRRGEAGQRVDLLTGANVVTPERGGSHAENVGERANRTSGNGSGSIGR